MKKLKNLSKVFVALLVVGCGIALVNADSRVMGGLISLNQNKTHKITMSDCTYSYYFGSAIATNTPSSGAYFDWLMTANNWLETVLNSRTITNLSTTSYSNTSPTYYPSTGTYRFKFVIRNSSYYGNVQVTNTTDSTLNI